MAATATPPLSAPPTAPQVASQQGGPVGQYLSGYQPQGEQAVGQPPMALVEQKLNQVALDLRDVARVLAMSKPALMPILQKMIQAGSMMMQEIGKDKQQGPQPGPPQPAQGGGEEGQPGQGAGPGMG